MEINPNEVYTTNESKQILKISTSTIKRMLKRNIIRANKIGGQYRILGKELLRIISPRAERRSVKLYQTIKKKIINQVKPW